MDLINCSTPEEVHARVREWSSDLSEQEQIVRATILDIQAHIEFRLKQVFYQSLKGLIFNGDGDEEYQKSCQRLEKMVGSRQFSQIHHLLEPILKAAPHEEFDDIEEISRVRNAVAHQSDFSQVTYKNRSPFKDPDALAQLFADAFAIREALGEFCNKMIVAPKALLESYEKFYWENRDLVARIKQKGETEG
jgi:hypothetical protein